MLSEEGKLKYFCSHKNVIAHLFDKINIASFSSSVCRMCNRDIENDTMHVLLCPHRLFTQHRNEMVSMIQLKLLGLIEEDMLPLCLLEWMLDPTHEKIDNVPVRIMPSLLQVGKRKV